MNKIKRSEITISKGKYLPKSKKYLWNIRYYPKGENMKQMISETREEALKTAIKIKQQNPNIKRTIRELK